MSGLWPRSDYADDQLYAKPILSLHVLYRGFQTGSIIGGVIGSSRYLLSRRKSPGLMFAPGFINSVGVGGAVGTALAAVILSVRMWNRDHIEWQDRSWRLLGNKGQVAVDTFSTTTGLVAAGLVLSRQRNYHRIGWKSVLGGFGIGNFGGIVGYMLYRYVLRGEFSS